MHYIRFLKAPRLTSVGRSKICKISALITITSDLGESFFEPLHGRIPIAARLIGSRVDGQTIQCIASSWEAGMRSLPLLFEPKLIPSGDELHIHVAAGDGSDFGASDDFSVDEFARSTAIVSAWSARFVYSQPQEAAKMVQRKLQLAAGKPMLVWEESGERIACHIWDAGLTLAAHLARCVAGGTPSLAPLTETLTRPRSEALRVIELGSGCGIVGIALAQARSHTRVLLTDLEEAEDIIKTNAAAASPAESSTVAFNVLEWGESLPTAAEEQRFDLVLLADCTYNPESSHDLVDTIRRLVERSSEALVVVGMKVRHPSEAVFFDLMTEAGLCQAGNMTITVPTGEDQDLVGAPEKVDIYAFRAMA